MIAKDTIERIQGNKHRRLQQQPFLAQLHNRADQDSQRVREFIRNRFSQKYDASVVSFLPNLISVCGKEGVIKSAVGYRAALEEKLYLEQYFSDPIEKILQDKTGLPIARDSIVEVGNLACVRSGYARIVIIQLTRILYLAGFQWVVFTLSRELQNSFRKLGLAPEEISIADSGRIKTKDHWGRYYDTSPIVMYGSIETGYQQLFGGQR